MADAAQAFRTLQILMGDISHRQKSKKRRTGVEVLFLVLSITARFASIFVIKHDKNGELISSDVMSIVGLFPEQVIFSKLVRTYCDIILVSDCFCVLFILIANVLYNPERPNDDIDPGGTNFYLGVSAIIFFAIRVLVNGAFSLSDDSIAPDKYFPDGDDGFVPLLFPAMNMVIMMCLVILVRRKIEERG